MREFIISTYEKLLSISIVITVLAGFFAGYNINPYDTNLVAGVIGAGIGFLCSITVVGLLFTIIAIKETLDVQQQELSRVKSILEEIGYQYQQHLKKQD